METKTAALTNAINEIGYKAFNNFGQITREEILSSFSQDALELIWSLFAKFVRQNYEAGKGTLVKGFGTFTFTNIEYNLEGTTNQYERDIKVRRPVFVVSSEFVENLRPGQYSSSGGLIYYTQKVNNSISIVKLNFAELAIASGIPKEELVTAFTNLIKDIGDSIKNKTFKSRDFPGIGVFLIRNNVFGLKFFNDFSSSIRLIPQRLIHIKKNIDLFMDVSKSNGARMNDLENAEKAMQSIRPHTSVLTYLTRSGERWLKDKLDIDVTKIIEDKKVLENVNPEKRFCNQTFFNKDIANFIDRLQNLKAFNLSNEVLLAIVNSKKHLIREMKEYDKRNNGLISKFEVVRGFSKANAHFSLSIETITEFINAYAKEVDIIEYAKLVNCLVKDIKLLIYQGEISSNQNEPGLFSSRVSKHFSFNGKPQGEKAAKQPLSNSMSLPSFKPLPLASDTIPIDINHVQNEILTLKLLMPNILAKYKETLASPMSFTNLINILREYSVTFPTDKILKILRFIQIDNPHTFTLASFNEKIAQCKLSSFEMTNDEIMKVYDDLKALIQAKGGKEMLFQRKEQITLSDFIANLQGRTRYTTNVLTVLFDLLTNKSRIFTLNDYLNVFNRPNATSLTPEFCSKATKAIYDHIAKKAMTINEYFNHLLSQNICRPDNTLSKECFVIGLKLDGFDYSNEEIEFLFQSIDRNGDGFIDRTEFNKAIYQDYQSLAKMQDAIKKAELTIDSIAYQFDINPEEPPQKWGFYQFKEKMRRFDSTFSNQFIEGVFNELTKGEEVLLTNVLLDDFNVYKKEIFRNVNNDTFKRNFIETIRKQVGHSLIKETFEAIDVKATGQITKATFCSVISRFTKEFKDEDILKFARVAALIDSSFLINYKLFLDTVYYDLKSADDLFLLSVKEVEKALRTECNSSIEVLMRKIANKPVTSEPGVLLTLSFEALLNYLKRRIPNVTMKDIEKFDIDSDGQISSSEIQSTIAKCASSLQPNASSSEHKDSDLSALDELTEETYNEIIKELRAFLRKKNLTEMGLFKLIDNNNDGFLSKAELLKVIDSIMPAPLLPKVKDNLFNYFDYFRNGYVDPQTFLLRFGSFKATEPMMKSNVNIEKQILTSFSAWISTNSMLSDTEIFAILDKDNDGIISLSDLKNFLAEILRMSKVEFNDLQVEKVIQAVSLTKNKNFGLADLKEFTARTRANNLHLYFIDLSQPCIANEAGGKPTQKRENEEWIAQAIERLGMFIRERFEKIEDFFAAFCDQDSKSFKLENLMNFHLKHFECFYGLNIAQNEIAVIFNSLDSEKKGYLALEDMQKKLSPYDFYKKMHSDIQKFLRSNFLTNTCAFKFFIPSDESSTKQDEANKLNKETTISTKDFFNGINYLFPQKYSTETLLRYIKSYFNGESSISYSKFSFLYYEQLTFNKNYSQRKGSITKLVPLRDKESMLARSSSSTLLHRSFKAGEHPQLKTPFDIDPMEKLKRLIASSKVDYSNYIKMSISLIPSGVVNQYEFKNIIKHLNIGLTTLEIDDIATKWSRGRDNSVNLKEFLSFIKAQDQYLTKAKNNIKVILGEIKHLLYKYYSNPKLGFEFNDPEIRRQMDFDKFKKIVYDMYKREEKDMPNFAVLKSVYDYIDLRKDGIVDLQEWTKVFGQIEGKYDAQIQSKQMKALREWEISNNVITIYKAIAHNKKIIREMIKNVSFYQGQSSIIHEDNLISILKDVFPKINLTNTQWKMIVEIADQTHSKLIDVDLFIQLVEHSAQMEISQPRFK